MDTEKKQAIVVDPGGDFESIRDHLLKNSMQVSAILLTHAHLDHLGAVPALVNMTQAPVYLHANDQWLYDNVATQSRLLGFSIAPLPQFLKISDDQLFNAGAHEAVAIHTPGHTPGSCCFYWAQARLLLTGDTLFDKDVGRTDLWGGSYPDLVRSIQERLFCLPEDTCVIPGHGSITQIGQEKYFNPYVKLSS